MRPTVNVEDVGRNKRVLLQLAACMFRIESGRAKSPHGGGIAIALAQDLRRAELKNAILAIGSLKGDASLESMIVESNARDASHPPHGSDFRTIGFTFSLRWGESTTAVIESLVLGAAQAATPCPSICSPTMSMIMACSAST